VHQPHDVRAPCDTTGISSNTLMVSFTFSHLK
jgi:hypothetical protein